jgi:hypothetical protein
MINIPVDKPTELIQCGNLSTAYPAEYTLKEKEKQEHDRKSNERLRGCWKLGVQFEPWET